MIAVTIAYASPVVVEPRYPTPTDNTETRPEASDDDVG